MPMQIAIRALTIITILEGSGPAQEEPNEPARGWGQAVCAGLFLPGPLKRPETSAWPHVQMGFGLAWGRWGGWAVLSFWEWV